MSPVARVSTTAPATDSTNTKDAVVARVSMPSTPTAYTPPEEVVSRTSW